MGLFGKKKNQKQAQQEQQQTQRERKAKMDVLTGKRTWKWLGGNFYEPGVFLMGSQ